MAISIRPSDGTYGQMRRQIPFWQLAVDIRLTMQHLSFSTGWCVSRSDRILVDMQVRRSVLCILTRPTKTTVGSCHSLYWIENFLGLVNPGVRFMHVLSEPSAEVWYTKGMESRLQAHLVWWPAQMCRTQIVQSQIRTSTSFRSDVHHCDTHYVYPATQFFLTSICQDTLRRNLIAEYW